MVQFENNNMGLIHTKKEFQAKTSEERHLKSFLSKNMEVRNSVGTGLVLCMHTFHLNNHILNKLASAKKKSPT